MLFPPFPVATRKLTGWGSESLLQSLRRRLERYFARLLAREELQEDLTLHEFLSSAEQHQQKRERIFQTRRHSLWEGLTLRRWFAHGDEPVMIPEDRIVIYKPANLELPDEVYQQEALERVLQHREKALNEVTISLEATIESIQRCTIAMGQVSKSVQDVTSAHVRHLVTDVEEEGRGLGEGGTFQEDMRSTERRFRELGDRFVDLFNQMQPGLQRMRKVLGESLLEVTAGQLSELTNVRAYVNKEIHTLRRYDEQVGKREQVVHRRRSIMDPLFEARLNAACANAFSEETSCKEEFEAKSTHLRSEMAVYWEQTSGEFFNSVAHSLKTGLDVGRINVDALTAWFPPKEI